MLFATPTRPAHRAPAMIAPQHRRPGIAEPQRAVHLVLSGLAAVILLSIFGLSTFFVVADKWRGDRTDPAEAPAAGAPWAISSRQVDPKPLSLTEIFPVSEIKMASGAAPYRISLTHIDTDCDIATVGVLGRILTDHGCSQVVRAGMTAPYGGYEVTAGVFNLAHESGTARVGGQLRALAEQRGSTFTAMSTGFAPTVDPQAGPLSQVSWRERGHYLMYCVITRPDGARVEPGDQYAQRITADLLDTYLTEEKIGARALAL